MVIHNPHALPLFREERGNKRHLDGRTKDAGRRTDKWNGHSYNLVDFQGYLGLCFVFLHISCQIFAVCFCQEERRPVSLSEFGDKKELTPWMQAHAQSRMWGPPRSRAPVRVARSGSLAAPCSHSLSSRTRSVYSPVQLNVSLSHEPGDCCWLIPSGCRG